MTSCSWEIIQMWLNFSKIYAKYNLCILTSHSALAHCDSTLLCGRDPPCLCRNLSQKHAKKGFFQLYHDSDHIYKAFKHFCPKNPTCCNTLWKRCRKATFVCNTKAGLCQEAAQWVGLELAASCSTFAWQAEAWPVLIPLLLISLHWIKFKSGGLFSHAYYVVLLSL